MGRAPLPQLSDGDKYEALLETCPSGDWEAPCEDPADGCPGAWYRSEFVASFRRYRRNEHGNPLINADTPGHILEALFYFEHHHSLAQMHFHEAIKA